MEERIMNRVELFISVLGIVYISYYLVMMKNNLIRKEDLSFDKNRDIVLISAFIFFTYQFYLVIGDLLRFPRHVFIHSPLGFFDLGLILIFIFISIYAKEEVLATIINPFFCFQKRCYRFFKVPGRY
ncbi:hypothetical protein HY061_02925 [Candidatus Azambacteria bacterium]|nr:hypothetical protein [Candidatus Azambacteria bacterium]